MFTIRSTEYYRFNKRIYKWKCRYHKRIRIPLEWTSLCYNKYWFIRHTQWKTYCRCHQSTVFRIRRRQGVRLLMAVVNNKIVFF